MMEMVGFVNNAKEALSRTNPHELLQGLMALATEKVYERALKTPPPQQFIDRYTRAGFTPRQTFTLYYESIGAALGVYELPASLVLQMEETWQSFSTQSRSSTTLTPPPSSDTQNASANITKPSTD
jgi:hypothetical protein